MRWRELKKYIAEDYRRIRLRNKIISFFYAIFWSESFKVTLWFRIGTYLFTKKHIAAKFLYALVVLIFKHIQHQTNIQIRIGTKIGGGLKFFHYGSTVIAQETVIGKNVSIHQGVTIGRVFNGKNAGVPTIGNNVVIFAGAKILGNIIVGDNAVIGANAVVIRDVPQNAVVAGVPAEVIGTDSSKCFNEEWKIVFAQYDK